MHVAIAGNLRLMRYFCDRIRAGDLRIDLSIVNCDGRNLYSIAGCAHEDEELGCPPSAGHNRNVRAKI